MIKNNKNLLGRSNLIHNDIGLVNFIKAGNIVSALGGLHEVIEVIKDQGLPIRNASLRPLRVGLTVEQVASEID